MTTPTPSPTSLIDLVNAAWGLEIISLARLPVGEDAESYLAADRDSTQYVVRVERARTSADDAGDTAGNVGRLEAIYTLTSALHARGGLLAQVVAPFRSHQGAFICQITGRAVAVFPSIAGRNAYTSGIADDELASVAQLLATLHATAPDSLASDSPDSPDSPDSLATLTHETFANPFEQPILRALAFAETANNLANDYQRRVCDLLLAERADLLATLNDLRDRADALRALVPEAVLTHGDPNLANILVDAAGRLHLIDWDGLALGPRERDLFAFLGPRFEPFLRAYLDYLAASGPDVSLHTPVFAFYNDLWALQEIADYTSRILFENTTDAQDTHAWQELLPYLPIPHARIQAETQVTQRAIERVVLLG